MPTMEMKQLQHNCARAAVPSALVFHGSQCFLTSRLTATLRCSLLRSLCFKLRRNSSFSWSSCNFLESSSFSCFRRSFSSWTSSMALLIVSFLPSGAEAVLFPADVAEAALVAPVLPPRKRGVAFTPLPVMLLLGVEVWMPFDTSCCL